MLIWHIYGLTLFIIIRRDKGEEGLATGGAYVTFLHKSHDSHTSFSSYLLTFSHLM